MRVSDYVFDTRLYEGDRTLVYAGVRESDGAPIVGKMVAGALRDLHAELALLNKLAAIGIVEALGVFDSSEGPVLVQRRFGDSSLAQVLHLGPLPLRRALGVALQLAHVLGGVHRAGVLHRDVKPANVLFDSQTDTIALADFGIAVELPAGVRSVAIADLVGTPAYVAPEQTGRTRENCDVRSDLYSLGVTLYQLFTGSLPFVANDTLELVAAHLTKIPERPEERFGGVPAIVGAIVMKLLAKSADERYQSAHGLAFDLTRCIETLAEAGTIPAFELGRSDRPARMVQKLYGRESQRAALGSAFERALSGTATLVLLAGRQGAGHSELIRDLGQSEAARSACAVGGWKSGAERPLAGISEALGALASNLLLLDDQRLATLRARLSAELGQVGQVIVNIAPSLVDVLGPQPALSALAPAAARGRLQHAFHCFVHALGEEQVFVLALSNVEHADPASLQLIESLLAAADGTRLLLILCAHESAAFGNLREHAGAVMIELGPLSLESVRAWTRATLECDGVPLQELSELLHEKSAGDPEMLNGLLEHFLDSRVIERKDGAFTWDLAALRAAAPPLSLGELGALRVAALSLEQRALLGAVARADGAGDLASLAAMLQHEASSLPLGLARLEREGLIVITLQGSYRVPESGIASAALAALPPELDDAFQGRLGAHLLRELPASELPEHAMRLALALSHSTLQLPAAERGRAAQAYALAADQATAVMAYAAAATFFENATQLLGPDAWEAQRDLAFRLEVGLARAAMMLGRHEQAERLLRALCDRDLTPLELGVVYPSRSDNRNVVMDLSAAIDLGLEGLARLGLSLPAEPSLEQAFAPLFENQKTLAAMSVRDHIERSDVTDQRALAAVKIISNLSGSVSNAGRSLLYVLLLETGLSLNLRHGYTRYYASLLSRHALVLHSRLGDYAGARRAYDACQAVQRARPAPELDGRTYLVLYFMICPWFGPWRDSIEPLAKGVQLAVEAGDPLFAAMAASASISLLSMCGAPLDQLVARLARWDGIMRAEAGVAVNAANFVNLAGKLSRGEAIEQSDLDRISAVPVAAGASRNNAMVNLGLALIGVGHEAQVRVWIDEVRVSFPKVNPGQPHVVTLWLLEGILAARDARNGAPERLAETERVLADLRKLQEQTANDWHAPAIALLAAEAARARGEIDLASGLYGRAASEARVRELIPLVAYAMEQRASMLERAGVMDDAALFYRESAIAYRRWGNLTKVRMLEVVRPELRTLDGAATDSTRFRTPGLQGKQATGLTTINDSLDLSTVLKVSQEISTQLVGSGVVRAVLRGITQNSGAERALFILRDASGVESLYGEVQGGEYRALTSSVADAVDVPKSVLRISRRTLRPHILTDAINDPKHASDPYVAANRCRSIAVVPVMRSGVLSGFVVLENRLIAGAFTPQLINLTQTLVAQAAISLENASLYENMEQRVQERTAALNARNTELRMVFDNVAEGLVMADMTARVSSEASAVLAKWYPEGIPRTLDLMFADDWTFRAGWDQLLDGFLPPELCIDQLPKYLRKGKQIFEVGFRPVTDAAGNIASMLVVLSDITEMLRQQEAEQEQKQMMAIFERLSQDRQGVIEFATEAANIVRELERAESSLEVESRLVHTLKGNSAFFGLSGLSALCHELESALSLDARGLTTEERAELCATWRAIDARLMPFLDVGGSYLQVRRADFELALRSLVREGHPIAQELELWKLEALETRFQRIAQQAQTLAERLGKAPITVELEHAGIRISGELWAPLWAAFVHAIRNAIDHGLETPEERTALGKGPGRLSLRAYFRGASFILELGDDGRGIAWQKVRAKALALGVPATTHAELVAALFSDGVSTKDSVDELSGRGIGMAALAGACAAMDGLITVESSAGVGTTWRFEFPSDVARLPRERRGSLPPSAQPAA